MADHSYVGPSRDEWHLWLINEELEYVGNNFFWDCITLRVFYQQASLNNNLSEALTSRHLYNLGHFRCTQVLDSAKKCPQQKTIDWPQTAAYQACASNLSTAKMPETALQAKAYCVKHEDTVWPHWCCWHSR